MTGLMQAERNIHLHRVRARAEIWHASRTCAGARAEIMDQYTTRASAEIWHSLKEESAKLRPEAPSYGRATRVPQDAH
jgi:hypothetical protein